MRPNPHAFCPLHVPCEIIDEDTIVGHAAELCKDPLECPDVSLRLSHVEREEPAFKEPEERMGGLDVLPPLPRLIREQHETMLTQRHEQLQHAWHRLPEGVPHPST